jgi:hypothetical protein
MEIRIVKPNAEEVDKERYLRKPAYLKRDTVEIELNKLSQYMKDHYIDPKDIKSEQDVVNVIMCFINDKLMENKDEGD